MKLEIKNSQAKNKRFVAVFTDEKGKKVKTTHFGAAGMSDYTKHKDKKRKTRYLTRHRKRENWSNYMSAGALSRYLLWGETSFRESIKKYKNRFNLK